LPQSCQSSATATIRPKARSAANNNLAVRHCAAQGLGIALLPEFQALPLVVSRQLKLDSPTGLEQASVVRISGANDRTRCIPDIRDAGANGSNGSIARAAAVSSADEVPMTLTV